MSKKQIIIIVLLVFILGGIFESFKRVKFQSRNSDGGINALLSDIDLKPFAQNFKPENLATRRMRPQKARLKPRNRRRVEDPMNSLEQLVKNQQDPQQEGEFSFNEDPEHLKAEGNGDAVEEGDPGVDPDAEDGEVAENAEGDDDTDTGVEEVNEDGEVVAKNDKKKKGKKKRKKGEDGEDGDVENPENEESAEEQEVADLEDELKKENEDKEEAPEETESEQGTNEEIAGVGSPFIPVTEEDEKPPLSEQLAEWADELLKFPDYKLMNDFISRKQAGQITNEVFYPIISMMLEDSREPMKVMGAYGLGATPSAKSFEMLVAIKATAPFGSRLSTEVSKHVQNYANIQYISSLKEVLYSSEDLVAIKTAAQLVDQAATNYLSSSSANPTESDVAALEQRREQHRSLFEGFLSILDNLAQSSSDQEVASAANQARQHIKQYIPSQDEEVSVVSN